VEPWLSDELDDWVIAVLRLAATALAEVTVTSPETSIAGKESR
jgi:hypothetical protein